MEIEFISLYRVGVGPTLVRFSEIYAMELTPANCTRLEVSWGHMIVQEEPHHILKLIRSAKEINDQVNKQEQLDPPTGVKPISTLSEKVVLSN